MAIIVRDYAPWAVKLKQPDGEGGMETVSFIVEFKELSDEQIANLKRSQFLISYNSMLISEREKLKYAPDDEKVLEDIAMLESGKAEITATGVREMTMKELVDAVVHRIPDDQLIAPDGSPYGNDDEHIAKFMAKPGILSAIWNAWQQEFISRSWVKNSESSDGD